MKQWNRLIKHFGEVAENSTQLFTFKYYGGEKYKDHIESCSCLDAEWNEDDKSLSISFEVGPLNVDPNGVIFYRQSTKSITIEWESGNTMVLFLKATIYEKDAL